MGEKRGIVTSVIDRGKHTSTQNAEKEIRKNVLCSKIHQNFREIFFYRNKCGKQPLAEIFPYFYCGITQFDIRPGLSSLCVPVIVESSDRQPRLNHGTCIRRFIRTCGGKVVLCVHEVVTHFM